MNLGYRTPEARLRQRMDLLQPNKCCVIIFTVSRTHPQSELIARYIINMVYMHVIIIYFVYSLVHQGTLKELCSLMIM